VEIVVRFSQIMKKIPDIPERTDANRCLNDGTDFRTALFITVLPIRHGA
jgi:hypothetical protein